MSWFVALCEEAGKKMRWWRLMEGLKSTSDSFCGKMAACSGSSWRLPKSDSKGKDSVAIRTMSNSFTMVPCYPVKDGEREFPAVPRS